jgi:prepilin-type N-terminal cleavage/methylation domain-containing protein/prepilin-type processing-associated H-X9-DG protein
MKRTGYKENRHKPLYLSATKPGAMDDRTRREGPADGGRTPGVKAARGAFTLIELLVVIAIIAILAAVLLPVLHQAMVRGETATCIDHQKQLATAWIMYANDNNDYCAGNWWGNPGGEQDWIIYKGKYSRGGISPCTNWVSGWEDPSGANPNPDVAGVIGYSGDGDNTNADLLIDPSYASLGDYTKNPGIYICPACQVLVPSYPGGGPKNNHLIRSVSMNCWVGFVCEGSVGNNGTYKLFNKTTAITAGIGPSDLLVFMEERGESIDDGWFEIQEGTGSPPSLSTTMANWPTDYHNLAATVGFADGHVEVHRWMGTPSNANGWGTTAPQQAVISTKWGGVAAAGTDLSWLQAHGSCPVN